MSSTPFRQLSRREFLVSSSAATAAIASAGLAWGADPDTVTDATRKPVRTPNLVIFLPDELRAESLGCYGHPLIKTPNIDRLAAEGTRFSHCVAHPLCVVSRASLFTGWQPHVRGHRSYDYLLTPDEPNMFRYLRDAGYDVFWFGKNDVLAHDQFQKSVTGWEFFADGPEWDAKDNPWPKDSPFYYSFLFKEGGDRRSYPDFKRIQAGIRVLRSQRDRPFCLFLPLWSPHPPYTGPADFFNMYRAEDVPPLRPPKAIKPPLYEAIRKSRRLDQLNDRDLRRINAAYLGMISYTDWLVGEFLEALHSTGRDKDTTIIFSSDHGDWAGDYGLVEKWSSAMDDCLTHVPLIIRTPGGDRGHTVEGMTQLYDLMATCLELAGTEAQHTHFARSLVPQLHGATGHPRKAAFSEGGYDLNEPQCFERLPLKPDHIYYPKIHLQNAQPDTITRATMMRTLEFKLVYRPDGTSEFYDLKKDPQELDNVFGEQTYATPQAAMQKDMLEWYIRTSDITPCGLADERNLPADHMDAF
jgi:arylsulfatase A-like enzyme